MKDGNRRVVDAVATAGSLGHSVKSRIERRLAVLEKWRTDGIPFGKAPPESLRQARLWEDEDLGILKISSPNEFTSTHPHYGTSVRNIAALLKAIKDRFGRQNTHKGKHPKSPPQTKGTRGLEAELTATVSQWHAERDKRLSEERGRRAADARCAMLGKEIEQKDSLIADLRRQLLESGRLRSVK